MTPNTEADLQSAYAWFSKLHSAHRIYWTKAEVDDSVKNLAILEKALATPSPVGATASTTHKVRSWSMFYEDILSGERTSDIRLNDRRYAVGDHLLLQEYDPVRGTYTGREQLVCITYIQQNKSNPCAVSREALRDDYAVLSVRLTS